MINCTSNSDSEIPVNSSRNIISVSIPRGWLYEEEYREMEEWVANNPGVYFNITHYLNFIDGNVYYAEIIFPTTVDKLAFTLAFSNILNILTQ